MGTIKLTSKLFKEKVSNYEDLNEGQTQEWKYLGDKPAIIDFYAEWCSPCKVVAPILEELADEYEGKVVIYKVNVEEESDLAALFAVRSIPTFIYIPMTADLRTSTGAMSKSQLKDIIETLIKDESYA